MGRIIADAPHSAEELTYQRGLQHIRLESLYAEAAQQRPFLGREAEMPRRNGEAAWVESWWGVRIDGMRLCGCGFVRCTWQEWAMVLP